MTAQHFEHVFSAGSDPTAPTLLLLHGTGGSEHDLLPVIDHLDHRGAVLSPRGKVVETGMARWFRRHAEGVFDTDDLVNRAGELAGFVAAAARQHGFDPGNVIAFGFSNGANIAASVLLLHPTALRGAVLFSAMLPLRPEELPDLSHAAVYLGQGRLDAMAPAESAEELARLLDDAGAAVTLEWHDAGHQLGLAQLRAVEPWLTKLAAATASDASALP
jgi:phospholipase/carboxylesterase